MCQKQTSVSHSSTASEIVSLDAGLRWTDYLLWTCGVVIECHVHRTVPNHKNQARRRHLGCRCWGIGKFRPVRNPYSETQCKGSHHSERWSKMSGGDQVIRKIHLNMDQPESSEELRDDLRWESDGSQSIDTVTDDREAPNDFWSIKGKLHLLSSRCIPDTLRYTDVIRRTHTTFDVFEESRIDDYWNIDANRNLSEPWTGFTQFTMQVRRWRAECDFKGPGVQFFRFFEFLNCSFLTSIAARFLVTFLWTHVLSRLGVTPWRLFFFFFDFWVFLFFFDFFWFFWLFHFLNLSFDFFVLFFRYSPFFHFLFVLFLFLFFHIRAVQRWRAGRSVATSTNHPTKFFEFVKLILRP